MTNSDLIKKSNSFQVALTSFSHYEKEGFVKGFDSSNNEVFVKETLCWGFFRKPNENEKYTNGTYPILVFEPTEKHGWKCWMPDEKSVRHMISHIKMMVS